MFCTNAIHTYVGILSAYKSLLFLKKWSLKAANLDGFLSTY